MVLRRRKDGLAPCHPENAGAIDAMPASSAIESPRTERIAGPRTLLLSVPRGRQPRVLPEGLRSWQRAVSERLRSHCLYLSFNGPIQNMILTG